LKTTNAVGLLAAALVASAALAATDESLQRAAFGPALFAGILADEELSEVSGIAASRRRDDVFFAINDGGNAPKIHAFGRDGSALGAVDVENAINNDWEALASFERDGKAYLLISDTGDNAGARQKVTLYVVPEPRFGSNGMLRSEPIKPAWTVDLRYPDSPHDCEAVAVDSASNQIFLLTKRQVPAKIFAVPIKPPAGLVVAKFVSNVVLPQPTAQDLKVLPEINRFRSQPTALNLHPAGTQAFVLTYRNAYVFNRGAKQSWAQAFSKPPQVIFLPPLPQAEAASYSRSGKSVYITSEKRPTPLIRLDQLP
jgi:hypothetical protein